MFKLNFKIALRNLWRNKASSLINVSGLAIGLAACLLLLLYVAYEWNFDRNTVDPPNTYMVVTDSKGADGEIEETFASTTNAIAPILKEEYAGVAAASRIDKLGSRLIANGRKSLKRFGCFADEDVLKIFDYVFVSGDIRTALSAPNSIIVTESTARVLFGNTNVLNKRLRFDDKRDLKITGVIKDLPGNTSVYFDFLMPWSLNEALNNWIKEPSWGNYNYQTIVRMNPATDISKFNNSIRSMMIKHADWQTSEIWLYSLNKLHLYDRFIKGVSVGGKIEELRLFMALAIGILLIACINFMNMATAKSEKRGKEVGVKKTIGASRSSLVGQFLMESVVLVVLSSIIAIVLIELSIPFFNNLLDIDLKADFTNSSIWLGLLAVVLTTGFISGSYPAFYLSSFNPVRILKKQNLKSGFFTINLRQVLVVGQFCFAIVLIIATAVIYKQIQYLKNRPLGYQVSKLVELPQEGELFDKFDLLKEQLVRSGAVTALFQSSGTISKQISSFSGMEWKGSTKADETFTFWQLATTYDFIKTTGVKLLDGRDFSPQFASDNTGVLLSESAVKRMNLKNPVGQTVLYHGNKCTIVGVFEDFIFGSPALNETPLVIGFMKGWGGTVTMRLNDARPTAENLATIEKIVKEINPAYPVELTFVDQLYAEKLKSQKILGTLSNVFGGLAIFISCLGLFGLAAYSAERRTKEIGIRKVLGASIANLMQLLSLNFLQMVFVAIVIAIPIAIYIMNGWLNNFDFHTSISWLIIAVTATGTTGLALLTVSFQAYKAARSNPVDALKYE